MKKLLFVAVVTSAALLSGCNFVVPMERFRTVQQAYDEQVARNEELQRELQTLQEQYAELEGNITQGDAQTAVDPYDEKILSSLFMRPDLIPVGGEAMRYFTDLCRVLGERYAYAYAEDGRNTADMILSYTLREDATYGWTLELYNSGAGWQVAEQTDREQTQSAATAPEEPDASVTSSQSQAASSQEQPAAPEASSSSAASSAPAAPKPAVAKPIPNEAQQQKFREIASLVS